MACRFVQHRLEAHQMEPSIRMGTRIYLKVLTSLVPNLREVRALVNMHTLPRELLLSILQPAAPDGSNQPAHLQDNVPQELRGYLSSEYNDVQQQARLPS
jgi:hypothetical protein